MASSDDTAADDSFRWKTLRLSKLNVRIRDQILGFLADSRLQPGARLPSERELAAQLGVSRPSVREAIKALEAEGRLDVRHGNGVFVVSSTEDALRHSMLRRRLDVDEVYAMREVLEVPAARWAAQRGDPVGLARIQVAHDEVLEASLSDDIDFRELQLLDAAFHQSIVQAAGNQFLEQTQGVLGEILVRGMATTLMVEGRLQASRADHRDILDSIIAGDGRRAGAAARTHVRAARRAALTILADEPDRISG